MSTQAPPGVVPGLMMRTPLLVRQIAERAELLFAEREVVSATASGVERSNYGRVVERARRVASGLRELGVRPGDRVATFGWNSLRHLELYLAVPSMGAVLHTLNIRLFEEDLRYVVGHAEDRVIFLDASLAGVMPRFEGVEHEVLMPDADDSRDGALDYEELIGRGDPGFVFPDVNEDSAAAMCYTSGTTGRPKGVVYSHRSTVIHTLMTNQADANALRERDSVMPVVPMFHANAWGLPYAAAMAGARLVMPGPKMDPASLAGLISSEKVTMTAAVPTIWQGLAQLDPAPDLSSLDRVMCGGSAVPESLIRAFDEKFGVPITQGWGMTETSPVASLSNLPPGVDSASDEGYRLRATAGRPLPFVEYRVDEESGGELQVRGPTIAATYYQDETSSEKFTEDGWLRTGDVAEVVEHGFLKLVDRTKDLVKSGGEWISSVELENVIMGHHDVLEAAVVAVPDERWGERPCACVVRREGSSLDEDGLREFLSGRVAKWWVPERVEFISEVPKTSVGKFDKKALRAQLADEGGS
ncbi:MAG TPA: long-chain fatty acid--CoA ligase [Solirubrobacteraceae bacterium]|jgi:fatty-acyl-CoA synthase|nr:long-chain fatty acid--CoA ligase [Solirubrobacteraceae bacterium]